MSKTLLVAGKDYPLSTKYLTAAQSSGRIAFATCPAEFPQKTTSAKHKSVSSVANSEAGSGVGSSIPASESFSSIAWNRASPVSARSVIIKAESATRCIDETLLIFDAALFASKYSEMSPAVIAREVDEMILGYSYLASEIISRYISKNSGKLIFLLRYAPSLSDMLHGVVRKSTYDLPVGIPVAAAQQYFISLAENIAAKYSGTKGISVLLVKSDSEDDATVADWLFPYIDETPVTHVLSGKNAINWIKPGTKSPSGFQLFHR